MESLQNRRLLVDCALCKKERRVGYSAYRKHQKNPSLCPKCAVSGEKNKLYKHGLTQTPTWYSWWGMKKRCTDEKHQNYPLYGGRGITFDPRWEVFNKFLKDMGERPPGMTLDRINNDAGYYKNNCRWADSKTQANNRRHRRTKLELLESTNRINKK